MSSRESISVMLRIRPVKESEQSYINCLETFSDQKGLKIKCTDNSTSEFQFDRVFPSQSSQEEIFEVAARPIIDSVLSGYNGTIFCYGQTSSGKTYTMEGVLDSQENKGIIPRVMDYIFKKIEESDEGTEFSVKVSLLEIYNEKIMDLIDSRKSNLIVKEDVSRGVWVQDASEIYVNNKEEMLEIFTLGTKNRSIASTLMNSRSSRSHSLFILTIFQKNKISESSKSGRLYLVDLAGSEKLSKTGATGSTLEEAKNINKSLMCLGMVINSLTEGKSSHVPYRDSKLTRILKDSLGGNSLTNLILTLSPSEYNDKESLSTLRFGHRAKSIKNKPVINNEKSVKELLLKIKQYEEKIEKYESFMGKLNLGNMNNLINTHEYSLEETKYSLGKYSNFSNNHTCSDCESINKKLFSQYIELEDLNEKLEKLVEINEQNENDIQSRNKELYDLNDKLFLKEMQLKTAKIKLEEFTSEVKVASENLFIANQNMLLDTSNIYSELFILKDSIKKGILNIESTDSSFEKLVETLTGVENNILDCYRKFSRLSELGKYTTKLNYKINRYSSTNIRGDMFDLVKICNFTNSPKKMQKRQLNSNALTNLIKENLEKEIEEKFRMKIDQLERDSKQKGEEFEIYKLTMQSQLEELKRVATFSEKLKDINEFNKEITKVKKIIILDYRR
jgi:kinesin family protein 5